MRQVASVVKDGKVRYFIADIDEGRLEEFATVVVPESFGAEQSVKLGFNLIAAVGLNGPANGHKPASTAPAVLGPRPALSKRKWASSASVVEYVAAHPGSRVGDIVEHYGVHHQAASSAVSRAVTHGGVVRRDGRLFLGPTPEAMPPPRGKKKNATWQVHATQVVEYLRAHPDADAGTIAVALLGEDTKATRQVIHNRIWYMNNGPGGPRIAKRDTGVGNGKLYRIEESDG